MNHIILLPSNIQACQKCDGNSRSTNLKLFCLKTSKLSEINLDHDNFDFGRKSEFKRAPTEGNFTRHPGNHFLQVLRKSVRRIRTLRKSEETIPLCSQIEEKGFTNTINI